ncbi:hypothetical protein BDZ89DRAFT_1165133, partial [Hymenopellis radicata]
MTASTTTTTMAVGLGREREWVSGEEADGVGGRSAWSRSTSLPTATTPTNELNMLPTIVRRVGMVEATGVALASDHKEKLPIYRTQTPEISLQETPSALEKQIGRPSHRPTATRMRSLEPAARRRFFEGMRTPAQRLEDFGPHLAGRIFSHDLMGLQRI